MQSASTTVPVQIVFAIGSLSTGGAESQLVTLARQLAAKGWGVSVFGLEAEGELSAVLKRAGIAIVAGGYDSKAPLVRKLILLARAEWVLVRELLRRRPHVLHAFLPLTAFMAAVAGRLCRVPRIVIARRALGTHQDRHPWWRPVDRIAGWLAHAVTANAHAVAADIVLRDRIPAGRVAVIYNGIDTKPFVEARTKRAAMRAQLGLRDGEFAIACVANLIPYKGHADLLDAFTVFLNARPASCLFLIGSDRGVGNALRERAARLHIGRHVTFLGSRSDVAELLGAMDMAVLASHEEGLSNALLEYLAAGLPVVATDVGGNAEVLAGLTGCHLVAAHDPAALAQAMILASYTAGDETAARARIQSVAQRFSLGAMVTAHLRLYGRCGPEEPEVRSRCARRESD
jgi:glycosyltransferase involved in cell wall biosynthesis